LDEGGELMEKAGKAEMKTEESWLFFLDRNDYQAYILALEEGPARRAYALYREGRVLEAARTLKGAVAVAYEVDEALWDRLYEAVPDMAWRAKGLPPTVTRRCSTSGPGRPSSSSGVGHTRQRRCPWPSSPASAGTTRGGRSSTTL
jgi:hypothetical protein